MTRVKSFQNKLAAVTGASRGIGFEIGKEALLSE
jgi:NAD(P)-dependent dehydrogenase (short-subunit alcohol dehydrogenase family)